MKKIDIISEITKSKPLFNSNELFTWIQQSEEHRKEYIRYKNIWALMQRGKEMDKEYIDNDFKLVKHQINRSKKKFNFSSLIKYAAIIILAVISGYMINTINVKNTKIAINEISVPNGNRSQIVLPDGSEVWLINGSKLNYPEIFTGKTREVELEGEAYFKIFHDKKIPFIVNVGKQRVKVLGTEFSIVAYPNDNFLQVDLVTGKVQFDIYNPNGSEKYKSHVLNPLHSLVLDKTSGVLKNMKIPDSFYKYWQEGIYEFKNESFADLAKKIERIYGVEVIFGNADLKENKFTGAFFIDSNIYTIIETFKRASKTPFEYIIDKNRIYIK